MIDKRLFDLLGDEKKNIIWIVLARVINLLLSISFYYMLSFLLRAYLANVDFPPTLILVVFVLAVSLGKLFFNLIVSHSSFLMSSSTRIMLRERIMKKAMALGPDGRQALSTSELTQVSVEGVEQLEVYYSKFIPQFFYSICSAIIVFIVLARYNFLASFVLLICVPLIPIAIVSVMKFAKKVLSHYWDNYLNLGEQFYENLHGLTTLKLFEQDGVQNEKMNHTALNFRNATMKLLTMQLNSITVMDIVAYGGAALGITLALKDFGHGTMNLDGMVMFILLSAEFFLPFRQLGSLFHVAMTGASAADRMFRFLDLPERDGGTTVLTSKVDTITLRDVTFSYGSKEKALDSVSLTLLSGQLTGIIGLSGSGKSTLSYLLSGIADGYQGEIDWNQSEMRNLTKDFIEDTVERVSNNGYVFAASIRYNLTFGDAAISDEQINEVLQNVNLLDFLDSTPERLDYILTENGANLSGGQRQRLLIARSLLRDKELYIFDEMTSSVDIESERIIMKTIERLSHNKIVVFISHRLYNVANAGRLVVLKQGRIVEQGRPDVLLSSEGYYSEAYKVEQLILEEGGN